MRVFLSSTYADLIPHRLQAAQAVERLGQETGRMEVFGARPQEPTEACFREIDGGDLFLGMYAYRYGYVPEGSEVSITEMEYQRAIKTKKPSFARRLGNEGRDVRWSVRNGTISTHLRRTSQFHQTAI